MTVSERVRIESAFEDDAEVFAEISKLAFDTDIEVGAPSSEGPVGYDSSDFYLRIMDYLSCYRIHLDDTIVGGIMVNSGREDHSLIERIFVDPNLFREGIGTRSIELLFELYPKTRMWTLGTPEWNVRTKSFYEKLGFVQVGWDLGHPKWRERWYEKVMTPSQPFEMDSIVDLTDGMKIVDVEGEILEKGFARQVKSRRRRWETLTVANAALGDDSGRVVLVLWNQQIRRVSVGDRIRVEYGYVSSYRGITQLNVGRSGKLIKII